MRFLDYKDVFEAYYGPGTFQDPSSPQYEALFWLAEKDEGSELSDDWVILNQRYVAAVFYFATNGHAWIPDKFQNWLSSQSICRWEHLGCDEETNTWLDFLIINRNDQMIGSLPTEMGEWVNLTHLEMSKYSRCLSLCDAAGAN